jgi:cell division protein FtsL
MLKLLLCVFGAAVLAALVLQLRQQRQELGHQNSRLHDQIKDQQAKLWNQQLQIAVYTAPNAITQTVNTHDLKMVPQAPLPRGRTHWIDVDTARPPRQPRR